MHATTPHSTVHALGSWLWGTTRGVKAKTHKERATYTVWRTCTYLSTCLFQHGFVSLEGNLCLKWPGQLIKNGPVAVPLAPHPLQCTRRGLELLMHIHQKLSTLTDVYYHGYNYTCVCTHIQAHQILVVAYNSASQALILARIHLHSYMHKIVYIYIQCHCCICSCTLCFVAIHWNEHSVHEASCSLLLAGHFNCDVGIRQWIILLILACLPGDLWWSTVCVCSGHALHLSWSTWMPDHPGCTQTWWYPKSW